MAQEAKDKIVVFAPPYWMNYEQVVQYRGLGAQMAEKVGAKAALIRSSSAFSVNQPHTGAQNPANVSSACITAEDADLLRRIFRRGIPIKIQLEMNDTVADSPGLAYNMIFEIQGWDRPNEIVVVDGHFDSWDVGEGAMDDGDGAMVALQSLLVLRELGFRPRRTIRAILWAGEEIGGAGSEAYFCRHLNDSIVFLMENDLGVFKPAGISYDTEGADNATLGHMIQIMQLLAPINASNVFLGNPVSGEDDEWWEDLEGINGAAAVHENFPKLYDYYFAFHHSRGDTMTVLDPESMNLVVVMTAVVAFVVADMEFELPQARPNLNYIQEICKNPSNFQK